MDAAARWRLVLGRHAETSLGAPGDDAGDPAGAVARDRVLEFLYDREHEARSHRSATGPKGVVSTFDWLRGARVAFPREAVEVLERDALARYGLTELVTDPQLLRTLEPSIELVSAILAFRDRLSPEVRVEARRVVREVVDQLSAKLRRECEPALFGAPSSLGSRPLRTIRNVDWSRTIRRNLRRWDPAQRKLGIDHPSFRNRQRIRPTWRILLLVDQSGSMVESLIHAAVSAAILASAPAVQVDLWVWDHRVVDLTSQVGDPLEVLLAAQLGGGTLLYPALRAAADRVTTPERTVVAVISDFELFDPEEPELALARELVAEGVRGFGFCALGPDARAAYDARFARRLADCGWWVGAVTPRAMVDQIARVLG
ncbi:MAG: VWA domain-containing protein, partial [Myxococcota bacterium]